jgi:hypothetical protein
MTAALGRKPTRRKGLRWPESTRLNHRRLRRRWGARDGAVLRGKGNKQPGLRQPLMARANDIRGEGNWGGGGAGVMNAGCGRACGTEQRSGRAVTGGPQVGKRKEIENKFNSK